MSYQTWDKEDSPLHVGEQELHARLGYKDAHEELIRRVYYSYFPDHHRDFYAQLPFLVAGSVDVDGWPWASAMFGDPGFISTLDESTLSINGGIVPGDPLLNNAMAGAPLSFLGIELENRRRNRMNGIVQSSSDGTLNVEVVNAFGNCPQYIHTRHPGIAEDMDHRGNQERRAFTVLDGDLTSLITQADTFFVASHNDKDDPRKAGGVDVNHRGGRPGFIKVSGNSLLIPDYAGNKTYSTLGNFLVNPKAGLLFIDFDTGDLIQLVGTTELIWDATEEVKAHLGAERAWRFILDHGHILKGASPLRWSFHGLSPSTKRTGLWEGTKNSAQLPRKERRAANGPK